MSISISGLASSTWSYGCAAELLASRGSRSPRDAPRPAALRPEWKPQECARGEPSGANRDHVILDGQTCLARSDLQNYFKRGRLHVCRLIVWLEKPSPALFFRIGSQIYAAFENWLVVHRTSRTYRRLALSKLLPISRTVGLVDADSSTAQARYQEFALSISQGHA